MGELIEKPVPRAPKPHLGSEPVKPGQPRPPFFDVRFVPARWLLALLAVATALFKGGKFSKVGIATLVWSLTPRRVRVAAAGLALAAAIVVAGSLAAIALLALQLS